MRIAYVVTEFSRLLERHAQEMIYCGTALFVYRALPAFYIFIYISK
jgi:hypothetical protein